MREYGEDCFDENFQFHGGLTVLIIWSNCIRLTIDFQFHGGLTYIFPTVGLGREYLVFFQFHGGLTYIIVWNNNDKP